LVFKLKDYTTEIKAEKSISEIETMLIDFGANAIFKECLAGEVSSISFKLGSNAYKLPANKKGVYKVLYDSKRPRHTNNGMKNREEHSYKVSWRIIRDWLHSQLSIIASGQAEPEQVLLPYMRMGTQTLYEAYVKNLVLVKALPEKSEGEKEYRVEPDKPEAG